MAYLYHGDGDRVSGVRLSDEERLPASAVIANVYVASVYEKLLPPLPAVRKRLQKLQRQEPSCSGFALLLGVRGLHPGLAHHNIFFSSDYRSEFDQIFGEGRPPDKPTIYLAITSRSTPEDAPPDCENWFVLVNAPALGDNWDWEKETDTYSDQVMAELAQVTARHASAAGADLRDSLLVKKVLTPVEIARLTKQKKASPTSIWRSMMNV